MPVDLDGARAFIQRIRSGDPRGDAFASAEGIKTEFMEAVELMDPLVAIVELLPCVWRLNDAGELIRDQPVIPSRDKVFCWHEGRLHHSDYWLQDVDVDAGTLQYFIVVPGSGARPMPIPIEECFYTREAAEAFRVEKAQGG